MFSFINQFLGFRFFFYNLCTIWFLRRRSAFTWRKKNCSVFL